MKNENEILLRNNQSYFMKGNCEAHVKSTKCEIKL